MDTSIKNESYLARYFNYKYWTIGCVIVFIILAFFYLKSAAPEYTVTARATIDQHGFLGPNELSKQINYFQSVTLKKTIDQYGYNHDPRYSRENLVASGDTDKRTLVFNLQESDPQKGAAFINRLVANYNAENIEITAPKPRVDSHLADSLTLMDDQVAAIRHKIASLKNPPVPVQKSPVLKTKLSERDTLQLKLFDVILPYLKDPASQFVLIPYAEEIRDPELHRLVMQFNELQLAKQPKMRRTYKSDTVVDNINRKLVPLAQNITERIGVQKNLIRYTAVKAAPKPQRPSEAMLSALNDSIASRLTAKTRIQQKINRQNASINDVKRIPIRIAMISPPSSRQEPQYLQKGFMYLLAVVIGLLISGLFPLMGGVLSKISSPVPQIKRAFSNIPSPVPSIKRAFSKIPGSILAVKRTVSKTPGPVSPVADTVSKIPGPVLPVAGTASETPDFVPPIASTGSMAPGLISAVADTASKPSGLIPSVASTASKASSAAPSVAGTVSKAPSPVRPVVSTVSKAPSPVPPVVSTASKFASPVPLAGGAVSKTTNFVSQAAHTVAEITNSVPVTDAVPEVADPVPAVDMISEVTEPVPAEDIIPEVINPVPASDEVTDLVPAVDMISEVTEAVPAEDIVSEVINPVPAADEFTGPVPAVDMISEVTEPVPAEDIVSEVINPVPAANEIADPVPAVDMISEVTEPVPTEDIVSSVADTVSAEDAVSKTSIPVALVMDKVSKTTNPVAQIKDKVSKVTSSVIPVADKGSKVTSPVVPVADKVSKTATAIQKATNPVYQVANKDSKSARLSSLISRMFSREAFEKIRGLADVKRLTRTPLYGTFSLDPESTAGFTSSPNPVFAIANHLDTHKEHQTILITSAAEYTKAAFSKFIAQKLAIGKKRTVLVDLNLKEPHILKNFELPEHIGVVDFIESPQTKVDSLLVRSKNELLYVIGAGVSHESAGKAVPSHKNNHSVSLPSDKSKLNKLINHPRVSSLLKELRSRFDYVILDAPPVDNSDELSSLMPFSDLEVIALGQSKKLKPQLKNIDSLIERKTFNNPVIFYLA